MKNAENHSNSVIKTGSIRNRYQSEPSSRDFIIFENYCVGDDGCVYQICDKDDAVSFLIYDFEDGTSANYAEDNKDYTLINEGEFDYLFSDVEFHQEIGKTETHKVVEIRIFDNSYYRYYDLEERNPEDGIGWNSDISYDSTKLEELVDE